MAGGQQTYGDGGFSIAGLIDHLGREAARLNGSPGAAPFDDRPMYSQPAVPFQSPARPHQTPGALSASPAPQGARYGQLYAPPANDLSELRRQQAAFARKQHEIAWQNRWLAAPTLAPVAAPVLLEGLAVLANAPRIAQTLRGPLNLVDREPWWPATQRTAQALNRDQKFPIWKEGRERLARANGISASEMKADVHHIDPLEWAHLKPGVDPNRLSNLSALRPEAHAIATREWTSFKQSLAGRTPSLAELMEAKLRIDRLVAPYVRRAGVARSNVPRGKGGPI